MFLRPPEANWKASSEPQFSNPPGHAGPATGLAVLAGFQAVAALPGALTIALISEAELARL